VRRVQRGNGVTAYAKFSDDRPEQGSESHTPTSPPFSPDTHPRSSRNTEFLRRQTVPDLRPRCASCQERIDPEEPVYTAADGAVAHVLCARSLDPAGERHHLAWLTRVGHMIYGWNPPRPSPSAVAVCRCGGGFVATTDAAAQRQLADHIVCICASLGACADADAPCGPCRRYRYCLRFGTRRPSR
jgi:hypothetical protein